MRKVIYFLVVLGLGLLILRQVIVPAPQGARRTPGGTVIEPPDAVPPETVATPETPAAGGTPEAAVAAAPEPEPVDTTPAAEYCGLSTEAFFKLPAVQRRIGKTSVNVVLLEAAVFQQTNIERAKNKLPAFKYGAAMNLMARRHSTEMAALQFFDHYSPTPVNRTLGDRLKNVGLVNVTAGENIAVLPAKEMGSGHYITHDKLDGNETWYDEVTGKKVEYYTYQELAETVVTQWMNSPPHHANIVNTAYVYLGVGVCRGAYEQSKQDSFYMTQNFCGEAVAGSEAKARAELGR